MPSSHLTLCRLLLLLPSIFPSIRVFSNESALCTKVLEFQLQHWSFQWTPRTDLLAVQGTPKSLLQYHSSKTSILHHTAFFTVQLSHSYVTTGKTIALTNSCEDLTHWKRLWCWEGLGAGGEGDARRWDGWMASPTRWTWVCVNWSWWWTGRPGMLQFLGTQRVRHDWATELNWTDYSL